MRSGIVGLPRFDVPDNRPVQRRQNLLHGRHIENTSSLRKKCFQTQTGDSMREKKGNGKRHATQQSVNSAVKAICDIMRRSNCAGALQYVPELTWILFLRILDERETREAEEAEAVNSEFTPSLAAPYRWRDWAAPDGAKRKELQNGALGAFFGFVNGDLIPRLKKLRAQPNAMPRQKVISEIFSGVERTRIDTERNFLDVLDRVNEISAEKVDPTHMFTISQVYEGLLLHRESAGRRVHGGGRRRENQFAVFHQRQTDGTNLVLRFVGRQSRQADAVPVREI